ncbi:MAG: NAD(P)/FAD-dependent oxidoreductase [Bdellovibrionales bacterium]
MSRTLRNIELGLDESLEDYLAWQAPGYGSFRVLRQSLDARHGKAPRLIYSVEVFGQGEPSERAPLKFNSVASYKGPPVVVVGAGPAGLFATLRLRERGIPAILLEQGQATEKRVLAIAKFWRRGELDPLTNVGFGEGGAGLFSDGKLITRIKSAHIPYVMQRLVQFGAPAEIEFLSNPHVGSDRIRRVIPKMREHLIALGASIRFNAKVAEILMANAAVRGVQLHDGTKIQTDRVILACGHSAEDMFQHLSDLGVKLEGKPFAIGLRIEHPQEVINRIQYREYAQHPKLSAANYKLAFHDKTDNTGVYSFCMCPGGYVLSCTTDGLGTVSNGMSNFSRGSKFANSAIVVGVDHERNFGSDIFGGLKFRRELEAQGLELVRTSGGTKELPAQRLVDFLESRPSKEMESSCPSGIVSTRLDQVMSASFKEHFLAGIKKFDREMKGFLDPSAVLHGIETRTSCPLRIPRDPSSLESISHAGLFPTGEGAGYAGGITSAACDGVRVADAIAVSIDQGLELEARPHQ